MKIPGGLWLSLACSVSMGRLGKCFVHCGPGVDQTLGSNWSPGGKTGIPWVRGEAGRGKGFKDLKYGLEQNY